MFELLSITPKNFGRFEIEIINHETAERLSISTNDDSYYNNYRNEETKAEAEAVALKAVLDFYNLQNTNHAN